MAASGILQPGPPVLRPIGPVPSRQMDASSRRRVHQRPRRLPPDGNGFCLSFVPPLSCAELTLNRPERFYSTSAIYHCRCSQGGCPCGLLQSQPDKPTHSIELELLPLGPESRPESENE